MENEKIEITMVLGSPCSGKTSFIRNNFSLDKGDIIVSPGKMLRQSVGMKIMMQDPNPNACLVTNNWVRCYVNGGFHTLRDMINWGIGRKRLVLDGYPRSPIQVLDMYNMLRLVFGKRSLVSLNAVVLPTPSAKKIKDVSEYRGTNAEEDEKRIKNFAENSEKVLDEILSLNGDNINVVIEYLT